MAPGGDSSQEKTQEPTPHKLSEAREKGEFARSREVTTVVSFLAVLLFLWLGGDYLRDHMMAAVRAFLRFDDFLNLSPETTSEFFRHVLALGVPIVLPLLLLVVAAGVAGEVGQVGIQFVKDPLEPKWAKLNPVAGFQRFFSLRQITEGLKAFLKVLIFAYVVYKTIRDAMPQISEMVGNSPEQGVRIMGSVALHLGFRTCGLLAVFAGADYWFQRWQYYKKLRMSHQEVKEEQKMTEGDPVLKARMRSIQMEIARKRMMHEVPKSDFVVTNPTHYAVAVRYDPEKNGAPVVTAKGQHYLAQKIREVAEREGVPIVENPPLARALYKKAPVGQPIPADLFKAVAGIMTSIWRIAEKRGAAWTRRGAAAMTAAAPGSAVSGRRAPPRRAGTSALPDASRPGLRVTGG